MGKVYNGVIRHGGGEHYPSLNQMIQDGWICSREMVILLTKQEFICRV